MPFERLSKKGLPFPVVDDPVATQELAELVDVSDAYIMEQWATDIVLTGGLTYAYKGGTVFTGGAYSQVADGTVTLAASDVNYVERDATGVVTVNQTAFTDTKLPMAKVTTDVTGITDIEDWRVLETPAAATVGSHVVATTVALGPSHSVSALSSGMVLRATGATTSAYGYLVASDIPGLNASKITTGTLVVARGGTGVSAPTAGKILLGAGASAMTQLDFGAAGGYVRSTGAAWARSGLLASDLTGTTLPASIVTSSLTTVAETAVTAHEAALTIGAAQITAGSFGTGAYVFDNTVSGITTLTATTLAGTLSTAAQPNVTGLGTQAQALDMGTQNITNVGTYSGGNVTVASGAGVVKARFFYRGSSSGDFYLSGGTDQNTGSNIAMFGELHGSLPYYIRFRKDATIVLEYDGTSWDFQGNAVSMGALTSSGIAIESGTPVITLKDTNNVLGDVAYSSYIRGTDSADVQAWWLGDGGSSVKQASFWATTGYKLG
ncbi:hypothetical protein LCGC14_2512210, partial [marine sediment metagenome]